jgi:tetratricopeptide (TPR) repeat protein
MLTDAGVLASLSEVLSPGELSRALRRLLRVPQAWRFIHDPEILKEVISRGTQRHLYPEKLAALALGQDDRAPYEQQLRLEEEQRLRKLIEQPDNSEKHGDLPFADIALLGTDLIGRESDQIKQRILSSPALWQAPYVVAWPHLSDPNGCAAALMASEDRAACRTAITAILANRTLAESARTLVSILGDGVTELLPSLMDDEKALAIEIVQAVLKSEPLQSNSQTAADLYLAGLEYHIVAEFEEAREALGSAWDEAHQLAAKVADQLADVARSEGDPITEVEAAGQALEVFPTATRRARYAHALLKMNREEEALRLFPEQDPTPVDQIVHAMALAQMGDRTCARQTILSAAAALAKGTPVETSWLIDMTDTIEDLGMTSDALSSAWQLLDRKPTSVSVHLRLARLLGKAGQWPQAIGQARLALALEPNSLAARASLASCLQESGDAQSALPYWMSLPNEALSHEPELISCALAAGDVDLAFERAEEFFSQQPYSPLAAVLLANAKRAGGDMDGAISLLEQVIDGSTPSAEAWLALADCRGELNEDAYAATLSAGVQSLPASPQLHYAFAQHLREDGQNNQALNHLKKAVDIDPENASFNDAYGSLLLQLGHKQQALPYLEEAVTREPGNWRSKARLAESYAEIGRLEQAADLLVELPENSGVEQLIQAGQILTSACLEIETKYAQAALRLLEGAAQQNADEPHLELWMAQALEQMERHEEALGRYQDFIQNNSGSDQDVQIAAVLGQGRVAIALGQTSLAISLLEQARELRPRSPEILLLLAEAYQKENLPQQALDCAESAVKADPENPAALQTLAQIEATRKSWKSAAAATERWAEIEPENIDAWLSLVDRSMNAELESTFRDAAAKAIWLSRSSPTDLIRTAEKLYEHRALSVARRAAQRASKQVQSLSFADLEKLAQVATALEAHESAASAWIELSAQTPDDPAILAKSADALWRANRSEEAIARWRAAVEQDRENPELHMRLARALVQNGHPQDGLDLYIQAASLAPQNARIALEVGRAFRKHGTKEEAVEYLRKAVELNPNDVDSQIALAQTSLEQGRFEEALRVLNHVTAQPDCPMKACAMAAIANLTLGHITEAKKHVEKAESTRGSSPSDAKWLARAEMRFGDWPQAFECYRQSVRELDDTGLKEEAIKAFLKIMDAQWLYADYANAYAHAPSSGLEVQDVMEQIDILLRKLEQGADSSKGRSFLHAWRLLHNPDESDAAIQRVHEMIGGHPSVELTHALAIAHLMRAQPQAALQTLQSRANLPNSDAWYGLLAGIAQSMQGQRSLARESFHVAAEHPAARPLASYLEGRTWLADGDSEKAIRAISEALGSWPGEYAWHVELGELYAAEGNDDAALPHYQQAVELDPDNHAAAVELARILRKMDQLHEAEEIYARVIQSRPSEGEIWKEAAQISLQVGKPEQALMWFERAQTLAPSDAQCIIGASKAAMELGDHRKAKALSEKAARMSPDDLDVLLGIGEVHTRLGKYENALEVYDRALGISDDPLTVQLSRAKVLTKIGRPGQAVGDLRLSLERAPEDHRLWAALAEACEADDDLEYALDAATKALRLSPRNPTYQMLAGRLARKHGQLDIALDQIAQAKSTLSHSPKVHYELGRIYEERREYSKALAAFEEALKLDQEHRDAYFHAGLVLKQLKAYQDSGRMFEKVVAHHPRDPEALHQLAAVRALQLVHGGIHQKAVPS